MEQHLPLDHPLGGVYRAAAALCGLFLLVFGIAGFVSGVAFLTHLGTKVFGLHTNGLLSLISVVFGVVLLGAALVGGNMAATVNVGVGGMLALSGVVNLALIRTDANFLAFKMSNIIFSFVVSLVLVTAGMYGRVTDGDPRGGRYDDRPVASRTGDS